MRRVVVVTGAPASGKTTVLTALARLAVDAHILSIDAILREFLATGKLTRSQAKVTNDRALVLYDRGQPIIDAYKRVFEHLVSTHGSAVVELPISDLWVPYLRDLPITTDRLLLVVLEATLENRVLRNRERSSARISEEGLIEMPRAFSVVAAQQLEEQAWRVVHFDTNVDAGTNQAIDAINEFLRGKIS